MLFVDEPTPSEAAKGQVLGDFDVSGTADPPANFSVEASTFTAGGALHIEKLEFFHNVGAVPPVTLTKGEGGTAVVHIWARRPLVQLIGTKCEFARTVRFSIPTPLLVGVTRVLLVNHDTGATQVLVENEALASLLREPELASASGRWSKALPVAGNGCGA
ncbi:hypothetical protein HZ992_14875 [Rhizobacter sp. AJA081-3]|uniref:hypothetical protein n=1 Tax=Rhizobacter sp. AJA081-3 TaxID=2753607 RepID=UPI001ADF0FF1|nr:hypothetical protein [Rhizobacter sp. AJA081-3]QTN21468.1 hypothetical protein HZ992_14875 [Rhizobacter sp. AJA081-3]